MRLFYLLALFCVLNSCKSAQQFTYFSYSAPAVQWQTKDFLASTENRSAEDAFVFNYKKREHFLTVKKLEGGKYEAAVLCLVTLPSAYTLKASSDSSYRFFQVERLVQLSREQASVLGAYLSSIDYREIVPANRIPAYRNHPKYCDHTTFEVFVNGMRQDFSYPCLNQQNKNAGPLKTPIEIDSVINAQVDFRSLYEDFIAGLPNGNAYEYNRAVTFDDSGPRIDFMRSYVQEVGIAITDKDSVTQVLHQRINSYYTSVNQQERNSLADGCLQSYYVLFNEDGTFRAVVDALVSPEFRADNYRKCTNKIAKMLRALPGTAYFSYQPLKEVVLWKDSISVYDRFIYEAF